MKNARLFILLALLTFGQATWAQNLIINSVDDWNTFAQSVTNGSTYTGQTVQLNADITVSTMAGVENKCFAGTFDGQGHTITLNMTANRQFTALFSYADGATFQNLKVDGTINTAVHKFCAGIVGAIVYHGCTFTNCVSDVTINSSINGDGTHGGLVAYIREDNSTFEGCAFMGKLLGANTSYVGGLVGFTDSRNYATVSFTNCVFHPQQVTMSGTGSQTFARWFADSSGSVIIGDNCYYSQTLGAAQGKQMRSITGGNYVTVAFSGNATTYERSGISAYSVGVVYGSTLYAGNGDTVSLNLSCTQPSGYVCSGYTTNNGTLTGTANPYTLTMPNEAVTIQAVLEQPPVAYVDENGVQQQCTSYTVVTSNLNFGNLPAGWYVVNSNITLNNRQVHFSGDAHLILCDGKTMNINCVSGMIALQPDGSLTLYGQSGGRGSLTVTSGYNHGIDISQNLTINGCTVTATGGSNGINTANLTINGSTVTASGSNEGINAGNLTINGSTVTATGGNNGIHATDLTINGSIVTATGNNTSGISATDLTINGGTVTATGSNYHGIFALWLTINSGTINATGNDSGIYIGNDYGYVTINGGTLTTNEIFSPIVTLGWSNTNDSITVGSFASYYTPSVSVKSGQAFYYIGYDSGEKQMMDTVVISGTLTSEEISAIGGKTLRPYIGPCAPPSNQEVTDITAHEANLHWNGTAESYNVSYYKPFFFDSFEEDLSQWTIYKEGDEASWEWGIENPHDNSADLNAHSGHYAAVAYSDFDIHADSWLVTPQIQLPNQTTLKFWIMRSTYDDAQDEYEVRLSTTGNAISDFTTILKEKAAANSYWTEVSIDLSEYDGQQCYIAIRHDFTNGFFIMVDDFGIFGWSEDIATTDNSLLIEDLLPETEYQWHVQANCGEEVGLSQWSGINNFTTLSTCPVPIGLSASNETNHGATLDWTGLSDSYQVMVGSSEGASWTTYTVMEVPFILDDAQHIQPGTSYTVKVKGFCDDEETDFCEPIVFTTTFSCWPVNSLSYENLTSFSVNLSWVLEDETQTAWQICLNGDESNLIGANTNEGFLLDGLMPDVEYTVKVRAYCDENDYSSWSSTITFTTPEVCFTPRNLAANNITAVSTDLSWTGREDVESYTVRYRTMAERTGEWITETTSETEAQLTDLDGGTTYEAQVRSDCNPDGWCNMITFTTLDENTKVFVFEGEWSNGNNWVPVGVPTIDNDVILRANATVFDVAEANVITIDDSGALIIEDGGQLKTNADVEATMKKFVIGYGIDYVETDNGYYLIALPATDSITAADAGLVTTDSEYDLYSWNRTATNKEWHNYKIDMFSLSNGTGYLYANQSNMEMNITATLRRSSLPVTLTPAFDEQAGGWNLYGNPFPCEAYITTEAEGMTFYRLVDNQLELIEGAIAPMEGFFVKATAANQTFTISREAPAKYAQP